MLRYIILTTVTFIAALSFGQATLYSTNFENTITEWTFTGDVSPNSWIQGICAGNGTGAGSQSLYITNGGAIPGCGATGTDQYNYSNAPFGSGSLTAIAYVSVDGTCASSLHAIFDYKIEGASPQDFGTLIYSTDGGTNWIPVSNLAQNLSWTSADILLPLSLNFSSFLIGFSFTYDEATVTGVPLAIDNFVVNGTDTQAPNLTCISVANQEVNGSCNAIADDYSKYIVTLSDNCTDSAQIVVTQNILVGSSIPSAPGTSTTVILTVKDESNNSNTCSFTLNITDEENPTILSCASNATIFVNNLCKATIGDYRSLVNATDNCPGTLTYTQNPPAGTVIDGAGVITTVVITVSDPFGNSTDCDFLVTTEDNILPTIICPTTRTIFAEAIACQASMPDFTGLAVFSDNCVSNSMMTVSQSIPAGTMVNSDQTITLTLTGGVPSTPQECQFTLQFSDTVRPAIICPALPTIYVNSSCEAQIPDYTGSVVWSDNCTSSILNMTFTQTPVGGTLASTSQSITLTAIDQAGNSRSCSVLQNISDTIRPQLTCPPNQTVGVGPSNCVASMPNYTGLVSNLENCFFVNSVVYAQSPPVNTLFNTVATVVISGTDESGNVGTCSFTVTPIDDTDPTISCPGATTVNTNSSCNYIIPDVSSGAISADNCTSLSSLVFSQTPTVGTSLGIGAHTITITVDDEVGNSATCNYQLTVADQTDPVVTCPPLQNVTVGTNCSGAIVNYTGLVTMTDNCNSLAQLTLSQSPVSGTVINSNTQITMTAIDLNGNIGTCNFFAVIIDNIDPIITCPPTYDIAINSSCQYTVPDLSGQVTGTDNCSVFANMTISQNPLAGTVDGSLTPILITLTDQQGNSATCITTLTPIDTEAPTITCPTPASVNNGTNCNYTLGFYGSTALILDNCSDYSVTQTPAAGSIVQAGINTIQLEVMDVGGNTAQCTFDLQVIETQAPTITCPSNISTCDPLVTYSAPVYSDNCSATMIQTDLTGLTSGDTFPIGTTTLTYTATDVSSNSQSCSFQVQIIEYPSQANIVEDTISLCQITSTVINADPAVSGIGEWTVSPLGAVFNNQFANMTGVNNLAYGINELVWTISTAQCGETSDTLIVLVSQTPLPASVQDTLLACNQSSVNLSASVPIYGVGTWTTLQGANISDVNLSTSSVSNLAPGWNQFIWTVSNGSCPTSDDTSNVFVTPTALIGISDTAICIENGPITLNGTTPLSDQSVSWLFLSGTGHLSNVQSATTVLEEVGVGPNILTYTMSHDQCPATVDTVTIVASLCDGFNPIIPTVITPNFDGLNDLFVINYLDLIYPECKVLIFNRWGSVVYESIGYQDPWDGTYNGEELPMGTYFYKVELNDSESTVYNGSISIIR